MYNLSWYFNVAEEELYSAHFVYESIYEEIPTEVSEFKVAPGLQYHN